MGDEKQSFEDAAARLRDAAASLAARRELREANLMPSRPTEDELKKLDSSMKRNTALIRKLRQLGEDSRKALLEDIAKTNQAKYVSEAVSAVAEAPLKAKDIPIAVQICSALHQRYAEFAKELVPALCRIVIAAGGGGASAEEERSAAARKRATLRLLVELLLCGLYTAHSALLQVVRQLSTADFKRDGDAALGALQLVAAFSKAGREELLGLTHAEPAAFPPGLEERASAGDTGAADCAAAAVAYRAELARRWALPPEVQAQFLSAAERMHDAACAALGAAHEALGETERENERVLNNRGDLPEGVGAAYEAQRAAFEALQRAAAALAEALDRQLPDLKAGVTRMAAEAGPGAADPGAGGPADALAPFDDEETKAFYEGLPELRAVVPAVLLGEGDGKDDEEDAGSGGGAAGKQEAGQDAAASAGVAAELQELRLAGSTRDPGAVAAAAAAAAEPSASSVATPPAEEEGSGKRALDAVLSRLPTCVSRELCDEVAVEFCYAGGAGKGARRRLARALCDVPHGALQLLPYYGRVMAVLAPAFPDVAAAVSAHLEAEFADLARRKDATARTLEPRVRNARYVAELLKFRLFPPGAAFSMLKALLDEFSGHNVDAACALVEGAGRYLYRRPDTATRLANMLDVMMKLRGVRNLDARQTGLVDSAYFAVHSAGLLPRRKRRPPVREYIRHLVYERLAAGPGPATAVLKRLRRVRWAEEGGYVLRTLLRAARKGRYAQLALLASLAAGLARYHPELGVGLVDAVMEEIAAGLEAPEAALYQRRVAYVRLLGELYAYKLATTSLVFSTLRMLVALPPAGTAPEVAARADPPASYFRVRLACTLLEACGSYFARGAARQRLDDFLPYLQRYVMSKPPPLPLDIELDLEELCSRLKLKPPEYESFAAACAALAAVEARALGGPARDGLGPIAEEGEGEDGARDGDDARSDVAAAAVENGEQEDEEESEESGEESGEEGGSSDDSDARSDDDGSEEEEEDGEEEGSDGESEDAGSRDAEEEEEEEEEMLRGRGAERSAADEEFDRELAALLGDAWRAAPPRVRGGAAVGPALARPPPAAAGAAPSLPSSRAAGGAETLSFRVMLRRGGKEDRSRELQIPVSAGVAEGLREKEARDAAERAEVKRLVLEADRREEAEEAPGYFGSEGQGQGGRDTRRRDARGRGAQGYYQRGRSTRALW